MEILLPVDMSKQVTLIKQLSEDYLSAFRKSVESLLPIGYTFILDGSRVRVVRTPKNLEDLKWSYINCELVMHTYGNTVTIVDKATPEDVYKLCGIMQLLVGFDKLGISDMQVIK